MAFFLDFPTPPEGHADARIVRSYITGGYQLPEPINKKKDEHNATETKVVAHH